MIRGLLVAVCLLAAGVAGYPLSNVRASRGCDNRVRVTWNSASNYKYDVVYHNKGTRTFHTLASNVAGGSASRIVTTKNLEVMVRGCYRGYTNDCTTFTAMVRVPERSSSCNNGGGGGGGGGGDPCRGTICCGRPGCIEP